VRIPVKVGQHSAPKCTTLKWLGGVALGMVLV
jgi:hypothetical protein